MFIEIEPNPNCKTYGVFSFEELSIAKPVQSVRLEKSGETIDHDVTGVDAGGKFIPAYAQKVSDSGLGVGYLIYGGVWGIRLKPKSYSAIKWDLGDYHQHGECYMIYESEEDIVYLS